MTVLSMPSLDEMAEATFGLVAHTISHVSDLDGTGQDVEFPGAKWKLSVVLPPMLEGDAEPWTAFLADLGGKAGRFYAGDPLRRVPRGSAASSPGTPLVDGAAQTGSSLKVKGGPNSVSNWLRKGDYLAVGLPSGSRSLHKVTADAATDGTGKVTLAIRPALRESPADGATVILSDPTCIMRLIDDEQAMWRMTPGGVYAISFEAIEAY